MEPDIKKTQWNKIWSRAGIYNRIISSGRSFYNYFFERLILKYAGLSTEMAELGCGQISLGLRLSGKIRQYVGIDYSAQAVSDARKEIQKKNLNNILVINGDALELPAELKEKFDLVWSQGLVEHFPDYSAIVEAHLSLAKLGGTVLISVPYCFSYHWLWFKLTRPRLLNFFWPWEGTDVKFLTKKELLGACKEPSNLAKVFFLPPAWLGFILGIIILKIVKSEK